MRKFWNGWTVDKADSTWSWLTLFSSTLLMSSTFGFLSNFSLFYAHFLREFKESREKTAWVGSIPLCVIHLLAWPGTWIVTKYGLRKVTIPAAFFLGGSFLMTSYAKYLAQLFATFSVPFGLAGCVLFMVCNISLFTYFDKRLPIALGILTGGSAVIQVGMTYVYIYLLDNFGLELTFQLVGAYSFAICVFASITYLPTKYPTEVANDKDDCKRLQKYLSVLKNKKYLIYLFAILVDCFAYGVSGVHQVQLGLEMGLSPNTCNQFPVFSSIGNGIGRLFSGLMLDFFVTNKILYFQGSLFTVGFTALLGLFIKTSSPLIAFIWILAFLDGNLQTTGTIILRYIIGGKTLAEGFSVVLMACSVPSLLGPPIIGLIVDRTNSYRAFFYIAGTPHLLACCIAHGLRYVRQQRTHDEDIAKRLNDNEVDEIEIDYEIKEAKELLRLETPV